MRTALPWTCPACQNAIRLSAAEPMPRRGVTYRCHICRLELMVDFEAGRMTLAPLHDDEEYAVSSAQTVGMDAAPAIADDRPRKRSVPPFGRPGEAGTRGKTRKPTTHFEQVSVAIAKKRTKYAPSPAEPSATRPLHSGGDSSTRL